MTNWTLLGPSCKTQPLCLCLCCLIFLKSLPSISTHKMSPFPEVLVNTTPSRKPSWTIPYKQPNVTSFSHQGSTALCMLLQGCPLHWAVASHTSLELPHGGQRAHGTKTDCWPTGLESWLLTWFLCDFWQKIQPPCTSISPSVGKKIKVISMHQVVVRMKQDHAIAAQGRHSRGSRTKSDWATSQLFQLTLCMTLDMLPNYPLLKFPYSKRW